MNNTKEETKQPTRLYSEKASDMAAQVWCRPATENKTMDVELAIEFAKTIDDLIETVERLKKWKAEQLEVSKRWDAVDKLVRADPRVKPGDNVSEHVLEVLQAEQLRHLITKGNW